MARPHDIMLGRKTYEIFAAHWPFAGDDDPMAVTINNATKYVASTTLKSLDWQNSVLLEGDLAQAVAKLKEGDGPDIEVAGSSRLIQTLLSAGLVDEFSMWIFPVVVGPGKRLFDKGTLPSGLELVESKLSTTGVLMNTYRAAGAIRAGSFAFEEPTELEQERRRNLG
jgi:dihydrofolate reductase